MRRDSSQVPPPPPDQGPLRDDFLNDFHASSVARGYDRTEAEKEEEASELRNLEIVSTYDVLRAQCEEEAKEREDTLPLRLFNLVYTVSSVQVVDWAASLGVSLEGVDVDSGQGSATVCARLRHPHASSALREQEKEDIVSRMHGETMLGRTVRVQRRDSSLNFSKGRYYTKAIGIDISAKCQICEEVGHRAKYCTNVGVSVLCHLCAGPDHEAAECVNLICYRCGHFGHHSRDCLAPITAFGRQSGGSAARSKNTVCSLCGEVQDHMWEDCLQAPTVAFDPLRSLDFDPAVVCMSCGAAGHVMCQAGSFPIPADKSLFCPNCGATGHYLDPSECWLVLSLAERHAAEHSFPAGLGGGMAGWG